MKNKQSPTANTIQRHQHCKKLGCCRHNGTAFDVIFWKIQNSQFCEMWLKSVRVCKQQWKCCVSKS